MSDDDLRRASDPATPPVDLVALSMSKVFAVQKAVALNPSAPLPALLALLARHDSVLANPALDLHLLERPDLFASLPLPSLEALARSPRLTRPALLGLLLTGYPSVKGALARQPIAPPELLAELLASPNATYRSAAADNPAAPPEVLALLRRAGAPAQLSHRPPVGPPLDPADREALVALGPWGAELVAANPSTPPELLRRLASHQDREVASAVADNPAAPPELLRSLLERNLASLALARHRCAPADVLARLAAGPSPTRAAVADNPSAPPSLLVQLLGDDDHVVRCAAMANPSLPDGWRRRLGLAGFPGDLAVFPARWGESAEEDLAAMLDAGPWLQRYAAMHPRLSVALCERLCGMATELRKLTAMRSGLPRHLVARLRGDPQASVRELLERLYPPPGRLAPPPAPGPLLRAPSLRAPLEVLGWLLRPGDVADAGQPLLALRQRSTGAVVQLRSPLRARLGAVLVAFGPVAPAEALAELEPWDQADDPRPALRLAERPGLFAVVPQLGESTTEGVITSWLVKPGDTVKAEQPVVTVGLDKCDIELFAPCDGVVLSQLAAPGEVVTVGASFMVVVRPTEPTR